MPEALLTPNDFGPIYSETDMGRFPVEPWNTFSNLIFLFIVIFFSWRLYREQIRSATLMIGLPILFVGFVGGTMFHATRSASIWLYLDFIPIMILSILASFYFWLALLNRPLLAFLACIVPFIVFRSLRLLLPLPIQFRISIGYSFLALLIILPAFIYSYKQGWFGIRLLVAGVLCFAAAVYFRMTDSLELLPMGTHFLWHLLGGISSFLIVLFIYQLEKARHSA